MRAFQFVLICFLSVNCFSFCFETFEKSTVVNKTDLRQCDLLFFQWRFDYLTATYYLLLLQKRKGMKFALPVPKPADRSVSSLRFR